MGGLQGVARIKLRFNTNVKSFQISRVTDPPPIVILHAYTESIAGKTPCQEEDLINGSPGKAKVNDRSASERLAMGMKLVKWLMIFKVIEKGEIKKLAVGPRAKENSDKMMKLEA